MDVRQATASTFQIQKVSYTHEAMIDLLLANPMISQGEVAAYFGYTQSWVSRILSSDAFREMYTRRKDALIDPLIAQGVETRLEALCLQSIAVLEEKLAAAPSADIALKTLEVTARAKGYGVAKTPQAQFNFVVHMPQKSADAAAWVGEHKPETLAAVATVVAEGGSDA